jgi:thiamine biosynthesis lipoprotein
MAIQSRPARERLVRAEPVMGTVISIDLRDEGVPEQAIDDAIEWLHAVDRRFSPYIHESEISRLGRGELTVDECHPDVRTILDLCEELRLESEGAFNAWKARADGRLDPSGVVKGWAVERAARIVAEAGGRNFAISAGGDVIARGAPEAGRKWQVGIRHPHEPNAVAATVAVTDLAIATSGSYERGHHILDGRTGEPARELLSLTAAGPSMMLADAAATAGFALGERGIAWVARRDGYDAYGITVDGRVRYSGGFARLMA